MKARLITIIGLFLFLLTVAPFSVNAQSGGFITGQLFNGTESGSSTAGQTVVLVTYLDGIESDTREILTDDDGEFLFEGLDTAPGYSYQVKTTFQSAEYYSARLEFGAGSANLTLVLPVYDSTEDDADISIMSSHVIIYATEGQFHITEYYLFLNDSDHTYIGKPYSGNISQRETLRVSVPQAAENLQFEEGSIDSYIQVDSGGFYDTLPVLPGTRKITFSYTADYVSGEFTFSQDVDYPIGSMQILVNGDVYVTTSKQMVENEPFQSRGESFQHYTASDVAPGQRLSLVLAESSPIGTQTGPFWIIIIVILLIVAAFLVRHLYSRKGVITKQIDTDDDVEELFNRIAALDDDYENGIINEDEYRELREKYKNHLAEMMEDSVGN